MNKQEAIERIRKFSEYPGTYPCAIVRTPNVIEVIKCIDEPEKVKVPALMAEKMKYYTSALGMLAGEYFDSSSTIDSDELANWIDQNSDKFFRAWLDGYEVEEPKYRVNIGGLYLKEPLGDTNDFTIAMTWNEEYAYPFDSWNMAREHTSELGGTIEKV
ncbi:DUF1642 domain-containing protein [Enterococcus hulanensis]|uniref:DUF1642 domain-containing protein n=1 Tax=Enterococcus hulanensis TaxID=2559929 RepID=UPI002891C3FE|nr:DUF1642 domain-containing protein [Enterococcus hulanensis]MDT2660682.1 DUF1642 domain-containing protein [Enterococcus hulanensis]